MFFIKTINIIEISGSRKSNLGPLPHVPSANAEIVNDRRKEKSSQESLTLHVDKNEFSPNAKIYLVLHDFDARGHKTISVKKNEKVELLHQTSVSYFLSTNYYFYYEQLFLLRSFII